MEDPRRVLGFQGEVGGELRLLEKVLLDEAAGAVFGPCIEFMPLNGRRGLSLSGLVEGEIVAEVDAEVGFLSVGGRGDSGTFHKLASSGKSSSSESLHSASSSFTDFRFGCHDPLLTGTGLVCIEASPGLLGDLGLGMGLAIGEAKLGEAEFGDGDRERLALLIALMAREGVDEFLETLRMGLPFGRVRDGLGPWMAMEP